MKNERPSSRMRLFNGDNTDYARWLDFDQQQDYEEENDLPMEEQERRDFVKRCRQAKVSVAKLKTCEKEVNNDQKVRELREKIDHLEFKLKHPNIYIHRRPVTEEERMDWQERLEHARQELSQRIESIAHRYFPPKRRNK